MTAQEFGKWIVGYYGEYPKGQKRDVWEYIKSWEAGYLDVLKDILLANYSSQFKTPPDIAAMTKLYPQVVMEQEARARLQRMAALPQPPDSTASDAQKVARMNADMKAVGVTMADKGWMQKVIDYRTRRGDYGEHLRIGAKPRWTL